MSAFRGFVSDLDGFEPKLASLEAVDAITFSSGRLDELDQLEAQLIALQNALQGFCTRAGLPKERRVYGPKMVKSIADQKTRFELLFSPAKLSLSALKVRFQELEQKNDAAAKLKQEQENADRIHQLELDLLKENAKKEAAKEKEAEVQRQTLHASAEKKRQNRAQERKLVADEKARQEEEVRARVAAKLYAEDERRRREAEAESMRAHQRSIFSSTDSSSLPAPAFGRAPAPAPVSPSPVSFSSLLNSSLSPTSPRSKSHPTEVEPVQSDEEFELIVGTAPSDTIVVTMFSASWCRSCTALAPLFDAISVEYVNSEVICLSVDKDDLKTLCTAQSVTRLPTVTFHANNEKVSMLEDASDAQLRTELVRLVAEREERLVALAISMSIRDDEDV
jgi:thiol-disulfide isomerase/thioredoxin